MLEITEGKGFRISFPNGVTVSAQFGGGNYCANYGRPYGPVESCEDCEVAIIGQTEFIRLPGEQDVIPHVTPMQLLDILNIASRMERTESNALQS